MHIIFYHEKIHSLQQTFSCTFTVFSIHSVVFIHIARSYDNAQAQCINTSGKRVQAKLVLAAAICVQALREKHKQKHPCFPSQTNTTHHL